MTAQPAISVVIPLYNKGPYIARAINSVLSQTYQNFDIIVIDDGSTDNGAEIVKSIQDPRIRLIPQKNQGVSAARNRGIQESATEYIAFLDGDDEWLPTHLDTLVRLRRKYPEAGAYGTAYLIKFQKLKPKIPQFSSDIPKEPWEGLLPSYYKAAASGSCPISASTVAIPKGVLNEMGGFSTESWWSEDTDLWGRIALKYPMAFSWDGMGIYHLEASNRTCDRNEPLEENLFVISALKALESGNVLSGLRGDLLEYVAFNQIQTACYNLKIGRPDIARRIMLNEKIPFRWRSKYSTLFWTYVPSKIFVTLRNLKLIAMRRSGRDNTFFDLNDSSLE